MLTLSRPSVGAPLIVAALLAALLVALPMIPASAQTARCGGRLITVDLTNGDVPTSGDDVIVGTPEADLIAAGEGDDVICGLGGDDTIYGQDGNDILFGGDGDDKLRGGDGADWVLGEGGSDDLNGGRDNDVVLGGEGDDEFVRGGTGDDAVDGGPGNDSLVAGNGGEDQVAGGPGNDFVTGGPRPDDVWGGSGLDTVKGNKGADRIWGNDGFDELLGGPQPDTLHGGGDFDDCNGGTEIDEYTACESLTAVETALDQIDDVEAPVRSLPPGIQAGVDRDLSVDPVTLWGTQLPEGLPATFNPVGTPNLQMELPADFGEVVIRNRVTGEEVTAAASAAPDAADPQLSLRVLRGVAASEVNTVLSEATRTLIVSDGCSAVTREIQLDAPTGITARADAISAGDLDGAYVWLESCNAPGRGFWDAIAIVAWYPGIGLVEVVASGTTQSHLLAAQRALATLLVSSPVIQFADTYPDLAPDLGQGNVFGLADFADAGMSVELPDRLNLRAGSPQGFTALMEQAGPDAPPRSSLSVTRVFADPSVSLDDVAVSSYEALAVQDSCVPLDGSRSVGWYLDPLDTSGVPDLLVAAQDITTNLGPAVAVLYEGCTTTGAAAIQLAIQGDGTVLSVLLVAESLADLEAFDRMLDTLIVT